MNGLVDYDSSDEDRSDGETAVPAAAAAVSVPNPRENATLCTDEQVSQVSSSTTNEPIDRNTSSVDGDAENGADASQCRPERVCGVCTRTEAARYTCPGCAVRYCSVACFQRHKSDTGCSGKRDATAFVELSSFSPSVLASDFAWLSESARILAAARKLAAGYGTNVARLPPSVAQARGAGRTGPVYGLARLPAPRHSVWTHARAGGVNLRLMPRGMKRQVENTSKWIPAPRKRVKRGKKAAAERVELQESDVLHTHTHTHEEEPGAEQAGEAEMIPDVDGLAIEPDTAAVPPEHALGPVDDAPLHAHVLTHTHTHTDRDAATHGVPSKEETADTDGAAADVAEAVRPVPASPADALEAPAAVRTHTCESTTEAVDSSAKAPAATSGKRTRDDSGTLTSGAAGCIAWRVELCFPDAELLAGGASSKERMYTVTIPEFKDSQPLALALAQLLHEQPGNAPMRHRLRNYVAALSGERVAVGDATDPRSHTHSFAPLRVYLNHPYAQSGKAVYVPVNADAALRDVLRGTTIIEFPTFTCTVDVTSDSYPLYLRQPPRQPTAPAAADTTTAVPMQQFGPRQGEQGDERPRFHDQPVAHSHGSDASVPYPRGRGARPPFARGPRDTDRPRYAQRGRGAPRAGRFQPRPPRAPEPIPPRGSPSSMASPILPPPPRPLARPPSQPPMPYPHPPHAHPPFIPGMHPGQAPWPMMPGYPMMPYAVGAPYMHVQPHGGMMAPPGWPAYGVPAASWGAPPTSAPHPNVHAADALRQSIHRQQQR